MSLAATRHETEGERSVYGLENPNFCKIKKLR